MIGNFKVKYIVIFIALIAAVYFGISKYTGKASGSKEAEAPAVPVAAVEAKIADLPFEVKLVGNVYAYETVAVKSRIDSQVTGAYFKDGDLVKEGQVLFELDDRALKAEKLQTEANLRRDEAQAESAKAQFTRYTGLSEQGYASKEKMEEVKANYLALNAAVAADKAALENIKVQLSYTLISAPITGRAGTISVTPGNNVKANEDKPLVTINQVQPVRVQVAIPERYYGQVKDAMAAGRVEVTAQRSDSPDVVAGYLEYIDNAVDTGTGTVAARAIFNNDKERLWPGMFVNVGIKLGVQKNIIVIPEVAVQNAEGKQFVFVIGADNKAHKKTVEVIRNSGGQAAIASGIAAGDKVVTDGILRLKEGAGVTITPAK